MESRISGTDARSNGISLGSSVTDRPQKVSVAINGFDYPGEVVFADLWQPWFGSRLPEKIMFRLVLLSEPQKVDAADIIDRGTVVAVPGQTGQYPGSDNTSQLYREIGRLNEIREHYTVTGDSGLQNLASSLVDRTAEAQRSLASSLAARWRQGNIVLAAESTLAFTSDAIFIEDDPMIWVEATAASLFARSGEKILDQALHSAETLHAQISAGNEHRWRDDLSAYLSAASGNGLDELFQLIQSQITANNGRLPGADLANLLVRQQGLAPGLASILVTAFVRANDAEAALVNPESDGGPRLNSHSLHAASFNPELIYTVEWLSDRKTGDWNSALQYVKVLLPHAVPSSSDQPDPQFAIQLTQVLEVTESRTTLTLQTLGSIAARGVKSLASYNLAQRLLPVLHSGDWNSFYTNVVAEFPDASEFAEAVAQTYRLRMLSEDAIDVQNAHEYVASADFGRHDQALAADAELLLARLDVATIIANETPAAPVLHDYQQWKRRYAGVYRSHHGARRNSDMELARRVARADLQQQTIQKLSTIEEVDCRIEPEFLHQWKELKKRVRPCSRPEHEIALQNHPYCDECGVRMGAPGHETEVESRIAEIENMLHRCSVQLSEMAVSRALSGEREDELRQLIQINALADLTAISHVLDDGVMSFLQRFASESGDGPTAKSAGRD